MVHFWLFVSFKLILNHFGPFQSLSSTMVQNRHKVSWFVFIIWCIRRQIQILELWKSWALRTKKKVSQNFSSFKKLKHFLILHQFCHKEIQISSIKSCTEHLFNIQRKNQTRLMSFLVPFIKRFVPKNAICRSLLIYFRRNWTTLCSFW